VLTESPLLLYPLAILSSISVLWMFALINTVVATVVARRENVAHTWLDAAPVMIAGLALALAELSVIDFGRAWLTQALGLPF
jgi:hypothetical protein